MIGTKIMLVAALAMGIPESAAVAKSIGKVPGERVGAWEVETLTDGFSDARRGITHTDLGNSGAFIIKCDAPGPDSLYISIFTDTFLGADNVGRYEPHSAKYRLDDSPAVDMASPYYDGKSASLIHAKGAELLHALVASGAHRFRAQFLTYNSNLATVDFDITGIAEAIRKTAAICSDPGY